MTLILHGFQFSVYTRIVKVILAEKAATYQYTEVNPFAADMPLSYLDLHPFRRVPCLKHDGFILFETSAISRYINSLFPDPDFVLQDGKALARMEQVLSIIDSYFYPHLVRQVFSHGYFLKQFNEAADPEELAAGLAAAPSILNSLEKIADEGLILNGASSTLADLHLGPMMDYFMMTDEGKKMLKEYPALSGWWDNEQKRPSLIESRPEFPQS
ncbi:MAG: glutathione S-transferase family protein [Sneathiellales bacterium]|nr:glutathione S-transferase family protein [Sneathiellales bacterium]